MAAASEKTSESVVVARSGGLEQVFAGPRYPRPHSAYGTTAHFGGFGVGQPENLSEDKGFTTFRRDPVEHELEFDEVFEPGLVTRDRVVALLGNRFPIGAPGNTRPHGGCADLVDDDPARDGQQPCPRRGPAGELPQAGESPQVGLLREVVGAGGVGQVRDEPPHVGLRTAHPLGQCTAVALARGDGQRGEPVVLIVRVLAWHSARQYCIVIRELPRPKRDYYIVRCETFREALSARLDGEQGPVFDDVVDKHLTTCAACRSWYADARAMRQFIAVRAAPVVPDLTELILERAPAPSATNWPARIALGIVAFAQLTLAVAQFLGVATGMGGMQDGGSMLDHLGHESTAWNFAVGAGLLWAALRPRAAGGQLPLLSGFVVVLTVLSAGDLIDGEVSAGRILSHVLVVLGLALLFLVHRQNRDGYGSSPAVRSTADTDYDEFADAADLDGGADPEEARRTRPWRRPASRHHAA